MSFVNLHTSPKYSKISLYIISFFKTKKKPYPFRNVAKSYDKMLEMAERLASDLTFARVDFYEVNGHPYFGEITLCPGNGIEEFKPEEWDNILGSWMILPTKKELEERNK